MSRALSVIHLLIGLWMLPAPEAFGQLDTGMAEVVETPNLPNTNAWFELARDHPGRAGQATPIEQAILKLLSSKQVQLYLDGVPASEILLSSGESLESFLNQWVRGFFWDISWHSLDGGGGTSTGDDFEVSGTVAQVDAVGMKGGPFVLQGGFWAITAFEPLFEMLFADGFESGDTSVWSQALDEAGLADRDHDEIIHSN